MPSALIFQPLDRDDGSGSGRHGGDHTGARNPVSSIGGLSFGMSNMNKRYHLPAADGWTVIYEC